MGLFKGLREVSLNVQSHNKTLINKIVDSFLSKLKTSADGAAKDGKFSVTFYFTRIWVPRDTSSEQFSSIFDDLSLRDLIWEALSSKLFEAKKDKEISNYDIARDTDGASVRISW